jgi:peptidyl-dipeptidase Dcp
MIKIMTTFTTGSCYSCYIAGRLKTSTMKVALPALFITAIIIFSCAPKKVNTDNPLMIEFDAPLQSVPFDKIETRHYKPAIQAAIDEARNGLDKIAGSTGKPTFQNTIEALEFLNYKLKRLEQVFFNINSAETSKEIQQIAQEVSPLLTAYYNDISLNEALFARVKQVYMERETLRLKPEELKLLEDTYRGFVRSGANLTAEAKEEYRRVTEELSMLSLKFEENLLDETNAYQLHLTDEQDLAGLPEFVREAAAMEAKARKLDGWLFTLKAPSYQPFMKFADNRKLREEIYRAYNTRCFKQNDKNNEEIIRKIVNYRLRLANLLGYETYADYILEERMAKTPDKVSAFLENLLYESKPAALREYEEVQNYARTMGADFEIQRWDWAYYAEKLKNEKFSITDEMTKPYFRLENVEAGVFDLAGKLYGISFKADSSIPIYHKDVKTFRVFDQDGSLLALLYVDYFPREGKQGGAWMTNYLEQHRSDGHDVRPHVSLVLNFTKPTGTKPSLLTYDEVRTFLHEFGHALHSIFSNCTYMSLAGTNVYRDFVELPSQIMENWAEQKEWLNQIAVHYETGSGIPDEMLGNILKSRNFNSGYAFVRQISFGLNDMAWHSLGDSLSRPVTDVEQEAMEKTELFPPVKGCSLSTGFAHIFSGGYAAGYYGYKWAEVLDADAFSLFEKKGIFDRATAKAFRDNILSRGGTEDPMTLYLRFRGQEASPEPLLMRSGLK